MDVRIRDEGSVVAFTLETEAAKTWVKENLETEPWQWLGESLVIDHRMSGPIIDGMMSAGLEVG